jgi:hypothetical protein
LEPELEPKQIVSAPQHCLQGMYNGKNGISLILFYFKNENKGRYLRLMNFKILKQCVKKLGSVHASCMVPEI